MSLYKEARAIALEAWEETGKDMDAAQDFIHQSCDSHEDVIYYGKAIQFCADWDTSDGEEFLEDCGGISQDGDSFGQIACRIAFATLYCKAMECLHEIEQQESE
tara:strand:+ start:355 stop:666 length:312 start_codon:yes stop_codon:yes gene_type:complete